MNATVPWYLNPLLLTPIFGLLGVVVGGAITFGSSYLIDEKRAERDREREDREHAREVKRAARLIALELTSIRVAADRCVKEKKWPHRDMPLVSLSTEARQKYVDVIAPDLSSYVWVSVILAFEAADTFKTIIGKDWDLAIAIPDYLAKTFVPLIASMDEGRVGLAPYEFGTDFA